MTYVEGHDLEGTADSGRPPVKIAGVDGSGNIQTLLVGTDGSQTVVATAGGNVASGATDSGNPVKVGGVFNSTLPTLTNGQRGDIQLSSRGVVVIAASGGGLGDGSGNPTSIQDQSGAASPLATGGLLYNGATWDRQRGNNNGTVLASAARTATASSADLVNYNNRGAHIVVDVTALADTPSVVFTVEGKDVLSGKYYTLLTSAAIVATGTTVIKVYPGVTAVANVAVSDILPRTWRVTATHGDADSITFSVGYSLVL